MTVSLQTAMNVASKFIQVLPQIFNVIQTVQASNRTNLTQEEWGGIRRLHQAAAPDQIAAGAPTQTQASDVARAARRGPSLLNEQSQPNQPNRRAPGDPFATARQRVQSGRVIGAAPAGPDPFAAIRGKMGARPGLVR